MLSAQLLTLTLVHMIVGRNVHLLCQL